MLSDVTYGLGVNGRLETFENAAGRCGAIHRLIHHIYRVFAKRRSELHGRIAVSAALEIDEVRNKGRGECFDASFPGRIKAELERPGWEEVMAGVIYSLFAGLLSVTSRLGEDQMSSARRLRKRLSLVRR